MYESVRKNSTDPETFRKFNRIAQSLDQARADLAILRAKLALIAGQKAGLYRKDSAAEN